MVDIEVQKNKGFLNLLMAGLTYMIPITITSGFLIAIASTMAFQQSPVNPEVVIWQFPETAWGELFSKLYQVGQLGFTVMIPVFAAGIAYSISGVMAIAPALLGGYIINDPSILDTESGAGFIGAIIIGFGVGYLVKYLNQIQWPNYIESTVHMVFIPFFTTVVSFIISYYIIGKPLSFGMSELYQFINEITEKNASAPIIYGAILGGMIGFDLGGPINKTASLVSSAIFIDTMASNGPLGVNGIPQAATGAAIAVAPIGIALATIIFENRFTKQERITGFSTLMMGFMGVSEGALPYIVTHPWLIISNTLTSALAGGIIASQNIHFYGGIGSPLGAVVGYMTGGSSPRTIWIATILGSALVNALIIGFIKKYLDRRKFKN